VFERHVVQGHRAIGPNHEDPRRAPMFPDREAHGPYGRDQYQRRGKEAGHVGHEDGRDNGETHHDDRHDHPARWPPDHTTLTES